ncbi:MAG: hypothetical protein IJ168_11950 [Eubacterium sp.]|nr:hypothetical protein [Eubacterium sp.]
MQDETIRYKIGTRFRELIVPFLATALFACVTYWMYRNDNALFFFPLMLTVVLLVAFLVLLYSFLFLRIEVGEYGFRHYDRPFKSCYYRYDEIAKAWDAGDKLPPQSGESYFHYTTLDGTTARFRYRVYQYDAVQYMLERIHGEMPDDPPEDEEF